MRPSDCKPTLFAALAFAAAAATTFVMPLPSAAQMLQLNPLAPQYTLGRFRYEPPQVDGWRTLGSSDKILQLVYAEQEPGADKIDTRFAVVMESNDIPPGTPIPTPHFLAELSRKQMSEKRKEELKGVSPILLVPGTTALYTYRLLVKSPDGAVEPEGYEVFYVLMAPDESQYIVVQAITKEKDYENKLYWTQFYGSLPKLTYTGPQTKPSGDAAAPAAPPAAADPAVPAAPTAPAVPAAPAAPAPAPKADTPGHEGHGH